MDKFNDTGSGALRVISRISREMLDSGDASNVIMKVLSYLGEAFDIDRVYIFKNRVDSLTGRVFANHCYEWCRDDIAPQINNPNIIDVPYDGPLTRWYGAMINGQCIRGNVSEFPEYERPILDAQDIKSIIAVPIIFQNVFWGFVGFDCCRFERKWSPEEIETLTIASSMISNFVIRTNILSELKENERRWYKAIEGSGEGVLEYDMKFRRLFISERGRQILGFPGVPEKDVFMKFSDVVREAGFETADDFFISILKENGAPYSYEFSVNVNGEARWFYSKGVAISRGVFGEPLKVIGTLSDITDRRNFDNKLKAALMEAESANKAKSSFLATMSHEIRTPLNGMIGFLHLLKEHVADDTGMEYLRIIDNSTETLLNIINSILDLSKIESGGMTLEEQDCGLGGELEAVARLFSASAVEKKLYLRSFIDPQIPAVVRCDQLRLRQVLSNLLNNALKFTPENGQIYFDASVTKKSTGSVEITFSVRDTGIGIEKQFLRDIFKPFTQADSSVSRKFGGSGLGLSIASKFIEFMGGEISISSRVGYGSTFSFSLTFPIVEENPLVFEEGRCVCYVEYPRCQWGFGRSLAAVKLRSVYYETIDEMVSSGLKDCYAAVFSVFYTTGEIIKDLEYLRRSYPDLPVLLVTYPVDVSIFDAVSALNVKILVRPASLIKLYEVLEDIKNGGANGAKKNQGRDRPLFSGRVLVAEDNVINSRLIFIMLEKYGLEPEVASNGLEAVRAFEKSGFDMILMDINMPVMDGITAAKKIRSAEEKSGKKNRTPIIALTANAMKDDAEEFLSAGMDFVLNKPVLPNALENVFGKFLKK